MLDDQDDDQEAEEAENTVAALAAAAVPRRLEPKLAAMVSRAIEREVQGRLDELFTTWRDSEAAAIKHSILAELLEPLVQHIARIATPRVTVEVPPANPTPVQLNLPTTKRRRRFLKDAQGEITGIEDAEE